MAFDLRAPASNLAKLLSGLLAVALFCLVAVSAVAGYLVYQIVRPARTAASYDLSVMMGHPVTLSFPVPGKGPGGGEREGFFFPGLRGAPTIIVCHGYGSQRSDVLTLVSALQDQQFNVFLFDFAGHGNNPPGTTLGYREVGELRSAMQTIATRDDVDPTRFGLWGVDMGGYVVLEVAATDPRVKAFIVDDAYSDPRVLVQSEVKRSGLTVLPMVDKVSDLGFRLLNYQFKSQPPVTGQLIKTKGVPKLFIVSEDRQVLATETMDMYNRAPDPKTVTRTNTAYSVMSDDSRKNYETLVVGFFLQNLPPTGSAAPAPAAAAKN
jgi:pimeloyl-ACP methyl ester carboxylesterase